VSGPDRANDPRDDADPANRNGDGQVCLDVVEAVAFATGRDVLELPPLYDAVDGDALESLVASDDGAELSVSFTYADVMVRAHGGGSVEVLPTQG
jgi:hypothetical protein